MIVKPPEICAPVEPSMPSGFSRKLMNGIETSSLSSAIAKWCELCSGSGLSGLALSAPRWATWLVICWNALWPLSLKSKVTIGSLPPRWSKFCSGFLMSVPERPGSSRMIQKRVGVRRVAVGLLVAQDEHAGLDLDDLRARLLGVLEALERRRPGLVGQAVVERLLGDLVEGVEARLGGGLAVLRHRDLALRRALDRVVEAGDGLLAAVDLGLVGLAVLVEDVLLPVVEEELRRRADLLRGALGVLDAGEVDLDLVLARARELRLGDAERVDALAHDVERALERLRGDLRVLGGLALIDEPDAALEVEAELRRVREQDGGRACEQAEDDQQDEKVAAAFGHEVPGRDYFDGVRTSKSPPSSS